MSSTRENVVAKATSYVRGLAKRRSNNVVTADDVQNFLSSKKFRGSTTDRMSVVRSVLNTTNFRQIGTTPSVREVARGRRVTAWTI